MSEVSATIEDAKLCKVSDLWHKKPTGVTFGDTEAIIVTAKTPDGRMIRQIFYLRLKADGSLSTAAISKISRRKQLQIARFLERYITRDVKGYNVRERVNEWRGKSVNVIFHEQTSFICV